MAEVQVNWTEIPGSKIRVTSMAHMALELVMIKAGYGGEQPGLAGGRVAPVRIIDCTHQRVVVHEVKTAVLGSLP